VAGGVGTALQVMVFVIGLIVIVIAVVFALRWVARRGAFKGLVLDDSSTVPPPGTQRELVPEKLIGRRGTAVTPLRPAGTAMFDGQRIDVVTEATFTPQGAAIEVTGVEGNRVIVRQVAAEPNEDTPSA